jgi:hypothetical protein
MRGRRGDAFDGAISGSTACRSSPRWRRKWPSSLFQSPSAPRSRLPSAQIRPTARIGRADSATANEVE